MKNLSCQIPCRALYAAIAVFIAFCLFVGELSAEEVLANQDIIDMVKADLKTELIQRKITEVDNDFDLTAKAMVNLRREGVPDAIIETMLAEVKKRQGKRLARVNMQIHYLTSERAEARQAAYLRLMQMGNTAKTRMLEIISEGGAPELRAAVIRAIGEMDIKEAVPALRILIEDPSEVVRSAAAEALAVLDPEESKSRSLKAIDNWRAGRDNRAIDGHLVLLAEVRAKDAGPKLQEILLESTDNTERHLAAVALGEIAEAKARLLLERALTDDIAPPVRAAAAESLAKIADPKSLDKLLAAARSDATNRAALYHALSAFAAKDTVPFLLTRFSEQHSDEELESLINALQRLTHQNFGKDHARWLEWWEENEATLSKPAATQTPAE